MASKNKTEKLGGAYPSMDSSYQCEQDVRTLTQAAEVLADRGRMSMAMKKFKKLDRGMDNLLGLLSFRGSKKRY